MPEESSLRSLASVPGLTVLCNADATTTTRLLAALIEQWGADGQRIGLVDVRGPLPNILSYATNQLGWYPETVWPLADRLELASMNGATLVALGHLHSRALRPVVGLVEQGIPVVTTLRTPSLRRAAGQFRSWWTLPRSPLCRARLCRPRVVVLPAPIRMVMVTADGMIETVIQLDTPRGSLDEHC